MRRREASIGHPSYNVKPAGAGTVSYVADWIGEVLDDLVGQIDQSIVVETTIDPKLQSVAEAVHHRRTRRQEREVQRHAGRAGGDDARRRGARAWSAGRNYAEASTTARSPPNASPARRSSRSFISPAMEAGLTPETIRQDAPLDIRGWRAGELHPEYFGAVTLTQALALSLNTVAVRLGLEVGAKNVVRTAHRLGISSSSTPMPRSRSAPPEVSLTELVGAYAPFANGGRGRLAACREQDPHHRRQRVLLYARQPDQLGQVIEPRHVAAMNTMMQETLLSRHRAQGRDSGLDGRRQDRHQPGFPRRLVHRLHVKPRHRRLARQ